MRIVFSRKGFDSTAGGFASPIFPDGTLYSIPIPSKDDKEYYSDLDMKYGGDSIQKILNDLTGKEIYSGKRRTCDYTNKKFIVHHDPRFYDNYVVLGQVDSSNSHLKKQGVTKGDIFLFFGWFKEVEKIENQWKYKKDAKDIHIIWSYMELDKVLSLEDKNTILDKYSFLDKHPHIAYKDKNNSLYLSHKKFKKFRYSKKLILTDIDNYKGRNTWKLPSYFNHPDALSYFKKENFKDIGSFVNISRHGQGQEFVFDLDKVDSTDDKEKILKYIQALTNQT